MTPQEIAVSILAELIGVKYGKIDPTASDAEERPAQSLRWTPRDAPEATVG